jgi:hypothetical protein
VDPIRAEAAGRLHVAARQTGTRLARAPQPRRRKPKLKLKSVVSPVARFVVRALAWLPPAFAVWYFTAPVLLWPVLLLVELVARIGFSDLVQSIDQSGTVYTFATSLKPGQAVGQSGNITVDVNPLLYSFGLPLYAALVVAAHEPGWWRKLAIGYVVIVPFVGWGVFADFLKNVAITSGTLVASQTGFSAWQREAIVFAFQMGSLILPTVVPAIVWVLTHRALLERLRGRTVQAPG